jgi:hypothetical protein
MALFKVTETCFIGDRLYREGDVANIDSKFGPAKSPCLVACDEAGEPLVAKATRGKTADVVQTETAPPADLG